VLAGAVDLWRSDVVDEPGIVGAFIQCIAKVL
jgi:hypothetical protein